MVGLERGGEKPEREGKLGLAQTTFTNIPCYSLEKERECVRKGGIDRGGEWGTHIAPPQSGRGFKVVGTAGGVAV